MQYHQIVLLHRIAVTLFLLHYMWKGLLLISDKKDSLVSYSAKTRLAEIVLSFLFLGTGIYLCIAGPSLSTLQWIKIAAVFASIPLAIVGFKRGKKPLAILSILLLLLAYGLAEMDKAKYKKEDKATVDTSAVSADPVAVGKTIYTDKCAACHGSGGDAQLGGAKNLKITQLTDEQQKAVIKNGSANGMPSFPTLSDDQLSGVVTYIKTLK